MINEKLGVKIYDESFNGKLVLNKFTKKQIKELCIDDLITNDDTRSPRLRKITAEIIQNG